MADSLSLGSIPTTCGSGGFSISPTRFASKGWVVKTKSGSD